MSLSICKRPKDGWLALAVPDFIFGMRLCPCPLRILFDVSPFAKSDARIDYLLERLANSPYNFIRNRSRYTGKQAERHLRWKYFRNRKKAKTAEEFVGHVATRSKLSGEPYFLEFSSKQQYPLRLVLLQELKSLDHALEIKRPLMEQDRDAQSPRSAEANPV